MSASLELQINGHSRSIVVEGAHVLESVVRVLELRGDRIAVEQNGAIVPRTRWASQPVQSGDRLEIVHFVGGGSGAGLIHEQIAGEPWVPSV